MENPFDDLCDTSAIYGTPTASMHQLALTETPNAVERMNLSPPMIPTNPFLGFVLPSATSTPQRASVPTTPYFTPRGKIDTNTKTNTKGEFNFNGPFKGHPNNNDIERQGTSTNANAITTQRVKMEDDVFVVSPVEALDISQISRSDELLATMVADVQIGDVESLKAIRSAESELFKAQLRINGGLLLFEAVRMGLYDVAEFLLANGCSLRMCHGMTSSALHLAAYNLNAAEFLDRLAMYSSNCVDVPDIRYNTPLHIASACNNVRGVETLLSHGADVHKENARRQCPLDLALTGGHVECVRLLLERYESLQDSVPSGCENINSDNFSSVNYFLNKLRSRTQMDLAAKSLFEVIGHKNVVKALHVMHCWDRPRSNEILAELKSLGISFSDDTFDSVKCRLECIDLLVQKHFKFSMLHLSLKHLSQECYFIAMKSLVENYGLSVNSVDALHYTPLHVAVDRSDVDGVKYLLDQGAMVNNVFTTLTPLEMALQKRVINEAIVRLLVERGAQINFIRNNGWCPLKGVLERHNEGLAQFLVDCGADVDLKNPATGLSIFFEFLFMTLCRQYNTRAMSFLLEHGASLDFEGADATPLHFIASVQTSRDSSCVDFMKLLIKYSSDINPLDVEGNTPLMKAIKVAFHSIPIIELLLESGANPNIQNSSGQTALDLAITLRKVDVISLLMEHCVEYDPNVLFSNKTVLLDAVIINMPYTRNELFAMHSFLVRQDVTRERQKFVEKFIKATREPDSDYLDDMFICLYELLRHSPIERSCMARMTSGSTVLFSEVELHVLKTKLSRNVNESLLRGVLEYRIVLNDGVSYVWACDQEILKLREHSIFPDVKLSFLLAPERDQLLLLSTKSDFRKTLLDLVSYSSEMYIVPLYPIFGVTLARLINDILAEFDLLSAAALFLNRHVSRIREASPHFKSLPQHIIDNILSYLSPNDLKNLIFLEKDIFPRSSKLLKSRWKSKLYEFLKITSNNLMVGPPDTFPK